MVSTVHCLDHWLRINFPLITPIYLTLWLSVYPADKHNDLKISKNPLIRHPPSLTTAIASHSRLLVKAGILEAQNYDGAIFR